MAARKRAKPLITKTHPVEGDPKSRHVGRSTRATLGDPQQYDLYRLEREEIGARSYACLYTLARCRSVCRSVCRTYGVPKPRLKRSAKLRAAAEWIHVPGDRYCTITLSTRYRTATDLLTILHELAHHIHFYLAGDKVDTHQDHGPEFMACYISILDTVRFIPRDAMTIICDRHGIKYKLPGPSIKSLKKVLSQ